MIHGVYANQRSFHPVEFGDGLNVVLAERTKESTLKDTRNGLGKSTLIDIIDFCLGSSATKGKGLRIEPLEDWTFSLELTLAGNRVRVTRAVAAPNRFVIEGDTPGWVEQPDADTDTGDRIFNLVRWRTLLGWSLFGLPRSDDIHKYKRSYRSLISYFMRRGPDAYSDPFRHFRQQKTWDIQLHAGFLLGLNWEYACKWQELKDQEEAIKAVEQAVKSGAMEGAWGSVGELEAERVQLEEQVEREQAALGSFKVHPQYEAVQAEADKSTAKLHELANANIRDRRRLSRYKDSVTSETPASDIAIERLYEETGLVFPDAVRHTLDEAKTFHHRIVENRRAFLETEIKRIERQIEQRDENIKHLTEERAASLDILSTHGALEEMTKLQERHVDARGRLARVQIRISEMKDLTARKRDAKLARTELAKVAERDHEQRRDLWAGAVRLFNEHSQALYRSPGRLVIDITETGYKYDVEIERSGSEGVGKMKVFCFDLMLLQFQQRHGGVIDFLVHDSVMYDGVDSRQRALALERADEISKKAGGQYICTMNSDMVPSGDFSDEFDFDKHVRLTLTDKEPAGSLLGIQFESPRA